MTKKIFALVMVVSIFGAIFASGCKKDEAAAGDTATTSTTAGKTDTTGTTAGADTAGKTTGS